MSRPRVRRPCAAATLAAVLAAAAGCTKPAEPAAAKAPAEPVAVKAPAGLTPPSAARVKRPPPGPAAASAGPAWAQPVDTGKPVDLTVEPREWSEDWKKAEAAKAKYADKIVEISGEVEDASPDPYGNIGYVYLQTGKEGQTVRCCTADLHPWAKVSPGSRVKIRGTWTKEFGAGDLNRCVIVEAGPNPAATVSAEQLGKECTADRSAAAAKYNDKYAYVEGEVTALGKEQYCEVLATLKAAVPVRACCGAGNTPDDKARMKALKPGDRLKVLCRIGVYDKSVAPDGAVSLSRCLPVP